MNYNYLLYFSVLAQTEHYTTAAARLGISQPALSSAIHNLENSLGGVRLFEKVGRNIRLTEEGRFYQLTETAAYISASCMREISSLPFLWLTRLLIGILSIPRMWLANGRL